MAQVLVLLCKFEGKSCALKLDRFDTLISCKLKLCKKWIQLNRELMSLVYSVAGHPSCILDSEDDFQGMLCVASSLSITLLDVEVIFTMCKGDSSGSLSVVTSVVPSAISDSVVVFEEDNMDCEYEVELEDELSAFCHHEPKMLSTFGWDKAISDVGQSFQGGVTEFRLSLVKLSVSYGFQFKYLKNCSYRVKAICAYANLGCKWMVVATRERVNGFFYVRKFVRTHTCGASSRTIKGKRMTSTLVASLVKDSVRARPKTKPCDVLHQFRIDFGMQITYDHAWLGVKKARDMVYGDLKSSYQDLRWYVDALLESNPGSYVRLDVYESTKQFRRLFIAFAASIEGFKSCRPTLCLDGTHLKSYYKGHLLAATGKDANQGLFPLCFAIVDSENVDNWNWFAEHLRQIIPVGRVISFITDRNSGLLDALPRVFPESHHAYCIHHLIMNLKDKCSRFHVSKLLKDRLVLLFKSCAYAPSPAFFKYNMDKLMFEGGQLALEFFQDLLPEHYANAYFPGLRYGDMCSNAAESFNSWILNERYLPITSMIDCIRMKLMNWFSMRHAYAKSRASLLCPRIDKKLDVAFQLGRAWEVVRSTEYIFEVKSDPKVTVDISQGTCSCYKWQLHCLPCAHAIACIMSIGLPLSDFVIEFFTTKYYASNYEVPIYPIPTVERSIRLAGPLVVLLPPFCRRPPGRPRTKRIRNRGEVRAMRCGRCGRLGNHNQRTCVQPLQ